MTTDSPRLQPGPIVTWEAICADLRHVNAGRDDGACVDARHRDAWRVQQRGDPREREVGLLREETRNLRLRAVARVEYHCSGPCVRQLLSVQRIREKSDRIVAGAGQRADARDDTIGVAVKLTTEQVRELAQGRGHYC